MLFQLHLQMPHCALPSAFRVLHGALSQNWRNVWVLGQKAFGLLESGRFLRQVRSRGPLCFCSTPIPFYPSAPPSKSSLERGPLCPLVSISRHVTHRKLSVTINWQHTLAPPTGHPRTQPACSQSHEEFDVTVTWVWLAVKADFFT